MKEKRSCRLLVDCLSRNRAAIILFLALSVSNGAVFSFYGYLTEAFLYAELLGLTVLVLFLVADYLREKRKADRRALAVQSFPTLWNTLPSPETVEEEDYRAMIVSLGEETERLAREAAEEHRETVDYYTAWVHQIKTPIAVMRFRLDENTEEGRLLSAELFRIEQYVDMALGYIRLGSETNDLVVKEYPLDDIIREAVRKFAPQFILRKLSVEYTPTDAVIVTDRKWFSCILEQFLSNAVKYTPSGSVTVQVSENTLSVSDTGIGIAEEDLPRIFEKGYTGNNGRIGKQSSGLGLYLAKKAADKLALTLSAESKVGKGSRFSVSFHSVS